MPWFGVPTLPNTNMANLHPYIVEQILDMALKSATPIETVRLAAVNKHTSSFLSQEIRKQALRDKIVTIIKASKCKNNSVKLLQGVTIAFTITVTDKKVRLAGNWIFTYPYHCIECNRKSMSPNMLTLLEDIITTAKYTKVQVNKKDVHEDTMNMAAMFYAAKK